MPTLYDIVNSMTDLLSDYAAAETEAEQDDILKLLKASKEELKVKVESCAKVRQDIDLDAQKVDTEIKRLTQIKKSLEARSERLKNYIGECLGVGNKLKTTLFNLWWTPSVSVDTSGVKEVRDLPKEFVRIIPQQYEVDKVAITKAWKEDPTKVPAGVVMLEKKSLVIK